MIPIVIVILTVESRKKARPFGKLISSVDLLLVPNNLPTKPLNA